MLCILLLILELVLFSFTVHAIEEVCVDPNEVEIWSVSKGPQRGILVGSHHSVLACDVFDSESVKCMEGVHHFVTEIDGKVAQKENNDQSKSSLAILMEGQNLLEKLPEDLKNRIKIDAAKRALGLIVPNWEFEPCDDVLLYCFLWFIQSCCESDGSQSIDKWLIALGHREGSCVYGLEDHEVRKNSGFLQDEEDNSIPTEFEEYIAESNPLNCLVIFFDMLISLTDKTFSVKFLQSCNGLKTKRLANGDVAMEDFRPFIFSCLQVEGDLLRFKPERSTYDFAQKEKFVTWNTSKDKSTVCRNRHWMKELPKILTQIGGEPFVIAVGKAHLTLPIINDDGSTEEIGVIEILKQLGYEVTQAKAKDISSFLGDK